VISSALDNEASREAAESATAEASLDDKSDDARLLASLREDGAREWIASESLRAFRRRFGEADDVLLPSGASMLARRVRGVLQRGPSSDHEHALARALAALALAEHVRATANGNLDDIARETLLLARDTPWDATGLIDAALGSQATPLWHAIVARLRILVERADPASVRAELLVGGAALIRSLHPAAVEGVAKLGSTVRDPALRSVFALGEAHQAPVVVEGRWAHAPAGALVRVLMVLTGLTLVRAAWRVFEHLALGHRRHARIEWRSGRMLVACTSSLAGRTTATQTTTLAPESIARIDWSGKRTGLVGGMFVALVAAGTFAGTFFAVVGARLHVASFFSGGVGLVGLALLLDQAPLRLFGSLGGQGRLVVHPREGEPIVVDVHESAAVDALLQRWAASS
jgi:hypothetical protein